MKRLLRGDSLVEVGHLRNVLEQAGIATFVKHEHLAGALGEIPFLECAPELWVLDDAELAAAQALLDEERRTPPSTRAWRCELCGEINEGQFAACWQCAGHAERA
jgi:hypothetical protein